VLGYRRQYAARIRIEHKPVKREERGFKRRDRHNFGAQPGMRGRDAIEPEQMVAGWSNQDAKFVDELDGI